MAKIKSALKIWIPIAFTLSIIIVLIYITALQNLRQSANDPQIQIAQDDAEDLQNSKSAQDIVGQSQVDLGKSLAVFIIIFDDKGKPIASQAVLDGRIPTPPKGVFEYTRLHTEDKISWEPKQNIRIASVLVHFEGPKPGFILVGRSLREIEGRITNIGNKLTIGWTASVIGSLILILLLA